MFSLFLSYYLDQGVMGQEDYTDFQVFIPTVRDLCGACVPTTRSPITFRHLCLAP